MQRVVQQMLADCEKPSRNLIETVLTRIRTRVSAAADRPARRRGSMHVKYSVSHHMVIKPFLLLGLVAEYRSRSTVVRRPSDVYDTHRRTKLTAPETISRFREWSKIAVWTYPTSIWRPFGVTSLEFRRDFWRQKTRIPGLWYGVVCVILDLA